MTDYQVMVQTADEFLAGTDSNIFLTLFGEKGQSEECRLNGLISGNAFERGQLDRCTLSGLPDLGRIYRVRVRSDHLYGGSEWRLSYVKVDDSTFRLDDWISDTKPRLLDEQSWPWPIDVRSVATTATVRTTVQSMNLLDTTEPVVEEYEVKYERASQVEVATDVRNAQEVAVKTSWQAPETVIGKFGAEISAVWRKEILSHQLDKSSTSLSSTDRRKINFAPGKLTLVKADWPEPLERAVATLGSSTFGLQWLTAVPANPSWTIASFGKGDAVAEPYATYIRQHYPDLVPLFRLPDALVAAG